MTISQTLVHLSNCIHVEVFERNIWDTVYTVMEGDKQLNYLQ
jgi:hypothetical protein